LSSGLPLWLIEDFDVSFDLAEFVGVAEGGGGQDALTRANGKSQ
jgi:hypothetical protein